MKRFLVTLTKAGNVTDVQEFNTTAEVVEAIEAARAVDKTKIHEWKKGESLQVLGETDLKIKVFLLEKQIAHLRQFVDDSLLNPTEEEEEVDMACGGKKGGKRPKK